MGDRIVLKEGDNLYPYYPPNVVDITNPLVKSLQGRYFVGETESLTPAAGGYGWGGLVNPPMSGVQLFLDIYTISNLSKNPLLSQIWFGSAPTVPAMVSPKVTSANSSLQPPIMPHGQVQFEATATRPVGEGTEAAARVVPAYSTTAAEKHGHWIIGPGQSILFTVAGIDNAPINAILSFGWWEEPVYMY